MNERGAQRAVVIILAAGLLVTAMITTNGSDHFRLPKELAFRAEAIALLALGAFWLTSKRRTWRLEKRPEFFLAAAIVCWTLITVATSTNRQLSVDSLLTVLAAVMIFIVTCLAAQTTSFIAIDVLMIGACVNAVIVILQELKIWTPFLPAHDVNTHVGSVGLLGNPNDVGTYLAPAALTAIVMAMTAQGRRRAVYAAIGTLLVAGVAASATRTAIAALVIGLIVFAIFHSRRVALVVAAIIIAVGLAALSPSTTLGRGARQLAAAASQRDYQRLFSERLLPFLTAFEMARDHPLTGVGPGCFKYHYMAYRVAMSGKYPAEWTRGYPMNWGEVHNDHLQVAAESGLPGYALYLAAIALFAGWRRRGEPPTPEAGLARALRRPLAVLVLMISIGQFPLELAAVRLMLLTLGALCLTWDRDGEDRQECPSYTPRGGVAQTLLSVLFLIVATIAIYYLSIVPYRDNLVLGAVEYRSMLAESGKAPRTIAAAQRNLHDLDGAERSRRLDPNWYLLYGANCELIGRWRDAADVYTRALRIDNRPELYVSRGLALLHLGHTAEAEADLAAAARFNPDVLHDLDGDLRERVAAAAGLR